MITPLAFLTRPLLLAVRPTSVRLPIIRFNPRLLASRTMSLSAAEPVNADPPVAPQVGDLASGPSTTQDRKRPAGKGSARRDRKKQRRNPAVKKTRLEGTHEEVLLADVQEVLSKLAEAKITTDGDAVEDGAHETKTMPYETEVTISHLSSTGDGLGFDRASGRVVAVPFSLPGDKVTARVYRHDLVEPVSIADLVRVDSPSQDRDDKLVGCRHFGTCSGCQFQMMDYAGQLSHKQVVVERAFRNFSNVPVELMPTVGPTMASPLTFGYRTKLTPHFDGPPGGRRSRRDGVRPRFEAVPPIGFMKKGTRLTIDIEDCPIGTPAIRRGMVRERARVVDQLDTYQRGVTILLRENTERKESVEVDKDDGDAVCQQLDDGRVEYKTCETDQKATTTEYIGDFVFQNPAGAFFQNNNSILQPFTDLVGRLAQPLGPRSDSDTAGGDDDQLPNDTRRLRYLVDAYSGSGLFTITLSGLFEKSTGIDISASSIEYATKNATLNGLSADRASFMAADAVRMFDDAATLFPANDTVVVLDPPRKGCDVPFLRQLIKYGPARIVYVSCNVHTQARDVGVLVNGLRGTGDAFRDVVMSASSSDAGAGPYRLQSVRGMDFFPQTSHVEGVAVLVRRD